ncbi:MAG TPA: vWA domain-containing protein [Verrucomicrobiae bacterium]|nr:vWA domain-containing protein [Verrucomicrobiae bacterium]
MRMSRGVKIVMPTVLLAVSLCLARPSFAGCGCMDLALIVDDTGSMGQAIADVQRSLLQVINVAEYVSGSDLRIGLITFPNDNVVVNVPFTTNFSNVITAVNGLVAAGGAGEPESSDESLQYAITGSADPSCSVISSNGPFGAFRPNCVKIAALITDAHPGECADFYTVGVSDVHAHQVAVDAQNTGVKIVSVYVPDLQSGGEQTDIKAIMEDYATTSGGIFVESAANGDGTGDGIADAVATCGVYPTQSATRNSRFWFTHGYSSDSNCVTLLNGILINGSMLDLGFLILPTENRTADNVINANDALIEALGFYWKSDGLTGEAGGTQNEKEPGSSVCKARKELAAELIAATANIRLLQAIPTNSFYRNGSTITNFPVDLQAQARTALSGYDPKAMVAMTALLKKFNSSGATNNYPSGLTECSVQKSSLLHSLARDPTTQTTCPGQNGSCATAKQIVFSGSKPVFHDSENISIFQQTMPSPTCNPGGRNAVWAVSPPMAATGRQFTVSTAGSNFDTVLAVWSGTCGTSSSTGTASNNLVQVACADNSLGVGGESLTFTTDGTNTFYIVVEGKNGAYGLAKLSVMSY